MAGKKHYFYGFIGMLLFLFFSGSVSAKTEEAEVRKAVYINEKTGYEAYFEDDARVISAKAEEKFVEELAKMTKFGHVSLKTVSKKKIDTYTAAREYYRENFREEDGIVFFINQKKKEVCIICGGEVKDALEGANLEELGDRVYRNSSNDFYASAALEMVVSVRKLMVRKLTSHPFRFLGNMMLAMGMALLMNFILVNLLSKAEKTGDTELIEQTLNYFGHEEITSEFVRTVDVYK